LYPLRTGLCFVERPATYIPIASISSVEFARAGGGSATFDFYVHTKVTRWACHSSAHRAKPPASAVSLLQQIKVTCGAQGGGSTEFGQLPQEELPALTAYVQQQRVAVGAPADNESDAEEEGTGEEYDAAGSAPASGREEDSGGSSDAAGKSDDEVCMGS